MPSLFSFLRVRILDRYIGRQVFSAALTGIIVLTGVFVLGNIFKKLDQLLGNTSLPLSAVAMFVIYVIPYSLIFTIPWAFLTSILLVFGRLSADNELTALRMTGMSMARLCVPVFLMAGALSVVCYYVNTEIVPFSKAKIKSLFYEVVAQNPAELFQAGKVFDQLPGYRIYTRKRDGNKLTDVEIFKTSQGKRETYTRAARAYVEYQAGNDQFQLRLENSMIDMAGKSDKPDSNLINDLQSLYMRETFISMSLKELKEKVQRVNCSMKETGKLWEEVYTGKDSLSGETMSKGNIAESKTEISMRYSLSIAVFTFALVGIPLGVTAQRRETSVGFAFSLLISVAYFVFIIIAQKQSQSPSSYPHLLMWIPNLIFLVVGSVLFYRLSKR